MSAASAPGPASLDGLAWLARVGASPCEPLSLAMGWSRSTTFSHIARLQDAGCIARVAMARGQGSLILVTTRGVRVAGDLGVGAPALSRTEQLGARGRVRVGRRVASGPRAARGYPPAS